MNYVQLNKVLLMIHKALNNERQKEYFTWISCLPTKEKRTVDNTDPCQRLAILVTNSIDCQNAFLIAWLFHASSEEREHFLQKQEKKGNCMNNVYSEKSKILQLLETR